MNTFNQQHIAILLNSLSPTGGVERDAIKCIKALAANGWHIHLLVSFPHPDMPKLLAHLPVTWHKIITLKRPPSIGQMIAVPQMQKILSRLRIDHPNMHAITFEKHPVASLAVGCTSRHLWHQAQKKFAMKTNFRPLWEWWNTRSERLCLENAKKIATYTEIDRQNFISQGIPEKRIDRIIVPINTDYFSLNFTIPLCERKEILIIGANPKLKGIDIALKAWESLHQQYPELSLRIAFRSFTTSIAIKRAKLPRVIASPFIDDPREYYNKARLVLSPSAYESWGNVIIESLSLGIPVVASKQTPSSEIIQSHEHGEVFDRTGDNDHIPLIKGIKNALKNTATDMNSMKSRHQHIVEYQSKYLTSTQWLCNVAQQPFKGNCS